MTFVDRMGLTLLHFLWQGTIICALYACARHCRPNVRYTLACAALGAMLCAPFLTFFLLPSLAVHSTLASGFGAADPVSTSAASGFQFLPLRSTQEHHGNALRWVVMVWFCGAFALSVRLAGAWLVTQQTLRAYVRPAPQEWQETLVKLGRRIGVTRQVRLIVSGRVDVPTVIRWLKPVVLVPVGALTGMPAEHVEALLAHELAHIRRHDYLVNVLQGIAEAFLFYHPGVWWISSNIRKDRELCCDDIAVEISGDALIYVHALASLELSRGGLSRARLLPPTAGSWKAGLDGCWANPPRVRQKQPGNLHLWLQPF